MGERHSESIIHSTFLEIQRNIEYSLTRSPYSNSKHPSLQLSRGNTKPATVQHNIKYPTSQFLQQPPSLLLTGEVPTFLPLPTAQPPTMSPPKTGPVFSTLYFAYGSNLSLTQMSSRCPSSTYHSFGVLKGYRWVIGPRGYANVVQTNEEEEEVGYGMVYQITSEDERKLGTPPLFFSFLYFSSFIAGKLQGES